MILRPESYGAFGVLAAALLCLGLVAPGVAVAQTEDADATPAESTEDERPVDEIVVTAGKPGDRKAVDTPYEEQMREQLLEEMDRMSREEEEIAWRRSATVDEPSRISFGYRPQDSARDRLDTRMTDLPLDKTKPATIFRFEF
jgi:hypothetical protein